MNRIWIVLLAGLAGMWACGRQNGSSSQPGAVTENPGQATGLQAVIEFDTLWHYFGTIIEGEQVVCYFDYQNTGQADLVLQSVVGDCGCTSLQWEREPLAPGEKASLQVMFDSKGRSGVQRKYVTVSSNASNPTVELIIEAVVERK